MNRLFQSRHARNLLAGIQAGRGVDSRQKIAGMTEYSVLFIGPTHQRRAGWNLRVSGKVQSIRGGDPLMLRLSKQGVGFSITPPPPPAARRGAPAAASPRRA